MLLVKLTAVFLAMMFGSDIKTVEKRFSANTAGRDFIVGDIHGTFSVLEQALDAAGFDPACDRLFSVGDLIDRGPESERALEFLGKPWFHPIRGNHEDILIGLYAHEGERGFDTMLAFQSSRNGLAWWNQTGADFRGAILPLLRDLPIMISIDVAVPGGNAERVGLVHAGLPLGASWTDGIDSVDRKHLCPRYEELFVLWDRSRFAAWLPEDDAGHQVAGVDRVFVGHTILGRPTVRGNLVGIDTGSYKGLKEGSAASGFLTLVEATASLDRIREAAAQVARDGIDRPYLVIRADAPAPRPDFSSLAA